MANEARSKEFHLGDLAGVITGISCLPNEGYGISNLLDWMIDPKYDTVKRSKQIELATRELIIQYSWLAEFTTPGITPQRIDHLIDDMIAEFGDTFEVYPIPDDVITAALGPAFVPRTLRPNNDYPTSNLNTGRNTDAAPNFLGSIGLGGIFRKGRRG